jgi:hypothetical protein
MTIRKCTSFLFCLAVTLALATPAFAWPLNDSETPGSVLVFPSFHTGLVLTPDNGYQARTRFEISVVCPPGADCSGINQVKLRGHWVCKGDPTSTICAEVDFDLYTTINGTITFDTDNQGSNNTDYPPMPPCFQSNPLEEENGGGYLIVWAIDPSSNQAIKFDGLIGDEVILGSSLSARAHGAIPIQAGEKLAFLQATDVNGNGALDFDGCEYKQVTGSIYGSVKYDQAVPTVETSLVLLTLDVLANQPNPLTLTGLNFYNEYETLMSSAANFICWGEFHLADLPGGGFLNTNFGTKGLVTGGPAVQNGAAATMIGVVETEEEFLNPVTVTGSTTITIVPGKPLPVGCKADMTGAISCTINQNLSTSIDVTREYGYPLLNDAVGIPTTFVPKP